MPNTPCGAASGASAIAVGDVVAAEHDQIRLLSHQRGHGAADVVLRHELAAMDVGDEADPQPGER
jgi:hypothetical protein